MNETFSMLPPATFLSDLIQRHLPSKQKLSNGGININCPMCMLNGQSRPDTRMRCGIKIFHDGSLKINCFNCKFATKWEPGAYIPTKVKSMLIELGTTHQELQQAYRKAYLLSNALLPTKQEAIKTYIPSFEEISLPSGCMTLSDALGDPRYEDNVDLLSVVDYALKRGNQLFESTEYYWTPIKYNKRLIVPFYHNNKIVGWVGRSYDSKDTLRYYANTPPNYLFNNHHLYDNEKKYVLLVEGVFDALSIDGVAVLGSKLTEEQAIWLKESGKKIIVIPDLQASGIPLVKIAEKYGFMVSFPNWEYGIKDANDAVNVYGKLWTIKSIFDNATSNKIKINFLTKKYLT